MVRGHASRDVVSYAGAARYGQGRSPYRDHEPLVRALPIVLVSVAIASFQTNLVPYFGQSLSGFPGWRAAYYGFGMLLLVAACVAFILNKRARRLALPTVAICALSGALVLMYPVDVVSKSFLMAMAFCTSLVILTSCIDETKVLHFAALAVAFNAVVCLVDIMLQNGFTNTAGRAAGLAQGPNLAASQLVLGAAVVWRAVPRQLMWSFLFLITAALVATLSRSGMAIGLTAALAAGTGYAITRRPHIDAIKWRDIGFGAAILCWMAAAMIANHRFSVASDAAYKSIGQVAKVVAEAPANIIVSMPKEAAHNELKILDKQVVTEGEVNSASARSLLMRRALIRYSMSPWVGVGPKEAHALAPHSTYLLFALAFGVAGLVVSIGFIGLASLAAIKTGAWEFPLMVAALFAVSHDMLLFPSSIILLAIGIATLQAQAKGPRLADVISSNATEA